MGLFTKYILIAVLIVIAAIVYIIYVINVYLFIALGISAAVNENLEKIISEINRLGPSFVDFINDIVINFNSFAATLPAAFSAWNSVYRSIRNVVVMIVKAYCPNGVVVCLEGAFQTVIADLMVIGMQIFQIYKNLFLAIQKVIEGIICDANIANLIFYTIPISCSTPPLPILDYLKWLAALFKSIFTRDGIISTGIANFFCDWGGECGLKATPAKILPHEFPAAVPEVKNTFQVLSRMIARPNILKNAMVGIIWNLLFVPFDTIFCALAANNFVPCIFGSVCSAIFKPFVITVLPKIDFYFFIVGPFSIRIDLASLFCVQNQVCNCIKCKNIIDFPGPCVIVGSSTRLTCAPCKKDDTVLDLFWDTILILDNTLTLSPVTSTSFTTPKYLAGQNQNILI